MAGLKHGRQQDRGQDRAAQVLGGLVKARAEGAVFVGECSLAYAIGWGRVWPLGLDDFQQFGLGGWAVFHVEQAREGDEALPPLRFYPFVSTTGLMR